MWALLPRWWQTFAVVISTLVTSAAIVAGFKILGDPEPGLWRLASMITSLLIGTIGLAAFSWRPLWRLCPQLNRWVFPDLNGTWAGTLKSTWVDPITGNTRPPIAATITIHQELFSVHVILKTGEGKSVSSREMLEAYRATGCYRIWYAYQNDPRAEVGHRSQQHDGVAFLEVDLKAAPNRLEGRYYTSRKTSGDIEVTRKGDDQYKDRYSC